VECSGRRTKDRYDQLCQEPLKLVTLEKEEGKGGLFMYKKAGWFWGTAIFSVEETKKGQHGV